MKEFQSLTLKQQKFIQNYIELNGNGAEAVRRSGYKTNTKYADRHAKVLLNSPTIKKELEKVRANMQEKHEINRDWITKKHLEIIDGCEKDLALKSLQELTKIYGLYAPEEKINTNTNTITVKETLEELKAAREVYKKDF